MNEPNDQQLLQEYLRTKSEAAFTRIVHRYLDLVYSAALRQVSDCHTAQDVAQSVFVALAQNAPQLTDRYALAGWLHGTARNLAIKTIRTDARRRAREQEAALMTEILSTTPEANWEHIAPHLDEALSELNESDRDAVLLRYFKNHDLRTVGATLGISDDAAQKRVSRAVERLREFFAKRGVTVGASGLVVVISANAVQAAPVGLALTISTTAALTGTTLASTTTTTAIKAIAMTALQKTVVTVTIATLAGVGIYEARQASQLRDQVQTLKQQQAPLVAQIEQLKSEWNNATNQLASLASELSKAERSNLELIKLRADATRLRTALQATASTNNNFRPEKFTSDDPLDILSKSSLDLIRQAETRVSNTIVSLDAVLKLTPEQNQQMRAILMKQTAFANGTNGIRMVLGDDLLQSSLLPPTLRMISLKDDSTPEQSTDKQETVSQLEKSIAAILSPEQLSAYELHKQDTQVKTAKEWADGEVLGIQKRIGIELTLEQQGDATLALQNFWLAGAQAPASLQLSLISSWFNNERQKALGSILTPTQLARYRQFLIQAEQEAKPEVLAH